MKKYQYTRPAVIEFKDGGKWHECHVVIEGNTKLARMAAFEWIVYNAVGVITGSRHVYSNKGLTCYYKTTNPEGGFDWRVRIW